MGVFVIEAEIAPVPPSTCDHKCAGYVDIIDNPASVATEPAP
jgi:hypothetical protein